ncbi:MAG: phosphodiester glycosidase family protein [Eubacteriales bacterium]|nr:phosphodiester glycosidase family protein [Eubacteriales bacterium]
MKKTTKALLTIVLAICLSAPFMGRALKAEEITPESTLTDLSPNAPEGTFLEAGGAPLITEESYQDEHINIRITKSRLEKHRADIVVADVWVSSVKYFRRGFALGKWNGEMRSVKTIAEDAGAILAMTGDYSSLLDAGLVAANGILYRDSQNRVRDNCLILADGEMVTYKRREMDGAAVLETGGLWHSFLFGPQLLENGEVILKSDSKIRQANPRSAIGFISPGHYVFVVADGRTSQNRGLTIEALSQLMKDLGCRYAYNMDGGQSAVMWFNGEIVNSPYRGGRRLTDIVYIGLK